MSKKNEHAFMQRFSIYSNDKDIAFPLVEFTIKAHDIVEGIKNGTFPIEQVKSVFQRASESIQAAIKEGQSK